jgi:GH24 family phage-related lysozyme (muramidase)
MDLLVFLILFFTSPTEKIDQIYYPKPYVNYLDTLLCYIPKHEGLMLTEYSCSAGHRTIGYGHVITKSDKFDSIITKQQADSILIKDILKAKRFLNKNISDTLKDNLSNNQYWTLVHFVFCKGIGNFNKSTLKKELENNFNTANVRNELLRWCKYRNPNTGKLVYSKWSENIRQNEISLWYNGYITK